MKKILLLALLVSSFCSAQIVNIPDQNFKSRLLQASPNNEIAKNLNGDFFNIDANNDNQIQLSEALTVSYLDVQYDPSFEQILDLTGIEFFTNLNALDLALNEVSILNISQNLNLEVLNCSFNNLSVIDVTNLVNLKELNFKDNNILNVELSQNVNLEVLNCDKNNIQNLNLVNNNQLKELSFTENQLSSIDTSNLINLELLSCSSNLLTSLDLMNNLNLITLHFNNNDVSNIEVSHLQNLKYFQCNGNNISSLNVNDNDALVTLACMDNLLTELDVSNNELLENLYVINNQLTELDLSNNLLLEILSSEQNSLTELNVASNTNLKSLNIGWTQITELDVSQNLALERLYCLGSQISQINVNNCINLEQLDLRFNEQLTHIFAKNGANESITVASNPNVIYVCVDDFQVNYMISRFPDAEVNTLCSFTPGGNFNTITGVTKFDIDNNGCEALDPSSNNIRIDINNGIDNGFTFTNPDGEFNFYVGSGAYTLTPVLENSSIFTVFPESVEVNLPIVDESTTTQDFCITPIGTVNDLEILIIPSVPARPGFDSEYQIIYKNKGNQTLTGDIDFVYSEEVLDYISASNPPDVQNPGNLNWNYSNLSPFETRSLTVTFNVNAPTETPPINIDDVLSFTATINPVSGDDSPSDNIFTLDQIVVGSYDPNDKICLEGDAVVPEQIGEYLHYNINFENTGTAEATFVVVKDVIDETMFDLSSLQVIYASHSMQTKTTQNKVEFTFDNINLEPEGKGNIVFKIKTNNALEVNDFVSNKADIFFDYNFPIETNFANTTFQTLSIEEYEVDNSISVIPNPVINVTTIKAKSNIKSIELYDMQGRIVQTKIVNTNILNFDMSLLSNGVYFLKIKTENGTNIEKMIKK